MIAGSLFGFLLFSEMTRGESNLTGFNLTTCGKIKCINIKSADAGVSILDGNYGLAKNHITIQNKKTLKGESLSAGSAYIDLVSKKIYIRDISKGPGPVALYDFSSEELTYFEK